jgi:valyl-tRNA synthetase
MPTLVHVLESCLRLMHPFLPFITEELWQNLKTRLPNVENMKPSIVIAEYPNGDPECIDVDAETDMLLLIDVIRSIRNVRAEFKIPAVSPIASSIEVTNRNSFLEEERNSIEVLARTESILFQEPGKQSPSLENTATVILDGATVLISLHGLVDTEKERLRLTKESEECVKNIQSLSSRLGNQQFLSKAPEEVVDKEKQRLTALEERQERIQQYLEQLKA